MRSELSDSPRKLTFVPVPLALLERSVIAILVILFALSLHRCFIANINWDEFFYLSQVHQYRNGRLSLQLQTLHVHLFGWLPLVSENEVHQIFAARVVLWLMSLASCWLIYRIAKRFCSRGAALLSAVFYFGFSYVVDYGVSFRYDPICAFLFVASLYFLLDAERSRYHTPLAAFIMALAMMISIKSVFYLSTIGAIYLTLFLFGADKRTAVKNTVIFAVSFAGSLFVLYQIHSLSLVGDALVDPNAYIGRVGAKTLLSPPLLPRVNTLINALSQNGPIWVFVVLGLAMAGYGAIKGPDRKNALILASFALPLLSLLIYRNAYPYFYVFLMPAVVILGGIFADVLMSKYRDSGSKVLLLVLGGVVLMISGSVVGDYVRKLPDQTRAQAETIALVHRMFPEPVPYIDRNSMISSFPKVGFFMSTWGMESYWARNRPIMKDLIRREQPKFIVANSCALDISPRLPDEEENCQYRLSDEDLAALRANFVHHWGAIYVAGKSFEPGSPSPRSEYFEILISGTYTLEAQAAVSIDGKTYEPGDQIHLDQALHTIVAADATSPVVLRFGENLYRPGREPNPQPIYVQL